MQINDIVAALDKEITRLQQARELLTTLPGTDQTKKVRGAQKQAAKKAAPKRRVSPEGRARMAAAQKARWATKKKQASRVTKASEGKSAAKADEAGQQPAAPKKKGRPATAAKKVGRPRRVPQVAPQEVPKTSDS